MKKYIPFVFAFVFCILFSACDNLTFDASALSEQFEEAEEKRKQEDFNNRFYIYTDPETKVQYIVYHEKNAYAGFGGITPRLNTDGSLIISEENK